MDFEPPIDELNDTAPHVPVQQGGMGRLLIIGAMICSLFVTVVITIFVLVAPSDEKSNTPPPGEVKIDPSPQPETQFTPTESAILPTASVIPTEILPSATPSVPMVTSTPLPTAAGDEISLALEQAPLDVTNGIGVNRYADPYTISGIATRDDVTYYTVVSGDTMSKISGRFGLSMCTLVWSNPRHLISPLYPDVVLTILPVDGVFYKVEKPMTIQAVANETAVDPYDIIDSPYNEEISGLLPDTLLPVGMKLIVPDGNGGSCNIWTPPVAVAATGTVSSGGGRALRSCSAPVENPGYPTNNPLGGARYTFYQAFTTYHSGVDLSARSGTPVYASGSGTVIYAGWNDGGYGNAIIIDHGGSYTLYAHLSVIAVQCGQSVNSMQQIGEVGSTGNSTGPHLHFEIRDAGFVPVNPVFNVNGGL